MKSASALILPLAGLASAVDVYFFQDYDCSGGYEKYSGANPDECILSSHGAGAVAFMGIPQDWNLLVESYQKPESMKGYVIDSADHSNGRNYICLGADIEDVNTALYTFDETRDPKDESYPDPTGCSKPLEWVARDGERFRLPGLSREEISDLIEQTSNGGKNIQLRELFEDARVKE